MTSHSDANGIQPLTREDFARLRRLIFDSAGILLGDEKQALLVHRLARRLRHLGLTSFSAYYERVRDPSDPERVAMLDSITTNQTSFFREETQFRYLETAWLPRQAARRIGLVRVWSAGCSTGQEAWSVAMMLSSGLPAPGVGTMDILATDLSTRALEVARAGIYRSEEAAGVPPSYLKAFCLRGTGHQIGMLKIGPALRNVVRFQKLNLHTDPYPDGTFDLILCRNVLIYFNAQSRARVVERLTEKLKADGLLLLGHSESLQGCQRLRRVGPVAYAHSTH